jgi:annexin A7/11
MGTDDDVFIEILTTQSRAQIQAIKQEYERANNMSLKRAIEKETSGSFEKTLIALLSPSVAAYTAQALHEAFDGVGVVSDTFMIFFFINATLCTAIAIRTHACNQSLAMS